MDVTGLDIRQSMGAETPHMLDMLWMRLIEGMRARAMPYRIKIADHVIEADTPDEVCELLKRFGSDGAGAVVELDLKPRQLEWTRMGVEVLLETIESRTDQRNLVLRLYSNKTHTGWIKEELVEASKMSAQQLGGVLAGLAKHAKKQHRPPLIKVERIQLNGRRTCRYRLDDTFRQYLCRALEAEKARTAPTPQDEMKHGAPIPSPIPANLR